jgi:hypothetical protein
MEAVSFHVSIGFVFRDILFVIDDFPAVGFPGLEVTMELWTDYEGKTIDGAYQLTKLISPEGRSAFFSTSNGTGVPTVIRLIESHFDDEEILARWRGVAALNHPNLVTLKKYGHVMLDETSLVYAVMEPVEANLGEILRERRLSVLETRQIAASLLAALESLHANGFVHEHVEPANVLAVGETIKLRSDCIREVPEGDDGRRLKVRDVHDYAVVLLQCLTQRRTLDAAARDLPLAAPFDEIVRKGISGEWGLAQISKALGPVAKLAPVATPAPAPKIAVRAQETVTAAGAPVAAASSATPAAAATSAALPPASGPKFAPPSRSVAGVSRGAGSASVPPDSKAAAWSSVAAAHRRGALEDEPAGLGRGAGLRAVIGLLAVVVLFLAWHFLHSRPATQGTTPPPISTPAPILENGAATPAAGRTPPVEVAHARPDVNDSAAAATGQWRVIAFTYNHEDQARAKSADLAKAHPRLQFGVFTPTGHAPYLVTIGGPMSREEAFALSGKAKREGLPRDVYAQNYRGRR